MTKHFKNLINTFQFVSHNWKRPILITAFYLFFILALPNILALEIPCLNRIPGNSYTDNECNVALVLDRYLLNGLIGLAIGVILLRLNSKLFWHIPALICMLFMLTALIFSFYKFIPFAEASIRHAPIILEPLIK